MRCFTVNHKEMFDIIRKKTLVHSKLFNGFTDFHSHLLPGVDDGIETIQETVEILDFYQDLGVKEVIFTPHIMEDYPENNANFLRNRFNEFQKIYTGKIKLSLGAEYMLDSCFEQHLDSDNLLTIRERQVLVETSYVYAPMNFYDLLNKIISKGYYVVLAHPERYSYMKKADYDRLKQMGIRFQLNILSLTSYYGKGTKNTSQKILEMGYYNYLGSDMHNLHRFYEEIMQTKFSIKIINAMKEIICHT